MFVDIQECRLSLVIHPVSSLPVHFEAPSQKVKMQWRHLQLFTAWGKRVGVYVKGVIGCAYLQGGDLSDSQRQAVASRRYGDVMTQKFGKLEITPSGAAEASR